MSPRRIAQLALLLATAAVAVVVLGSGDEPYQVRAELPNAQGLKKNGAIKIAGITAGTAEKFEVTRRGTVVVTFDMDKAAAPLGAGATVKIRPANLLGERYAQLEPGDRGRPLPSGSLIPRSRTAVSVELDDVLNMLDQPTRAALRVLINEAGVALAGRGTDFNRLLGVLPTSLERTRALVGEVARENASLRRLIAQGDRVAGAVHGRRDELGRLVGSARDALETVASRRRELGATIAGAPGALSRLRSTLAALDSTAGALRPAAADLRDTAAPLSATLRELPAFAGAADDTLRAARRVSPDLRRLGLRAAPTVARLRPTLDRLERVVTSSRPSVDALAVPSGGVDQLLWFLQAFSRTAQDSDGLGHTYGVHVSVSDQIVNNMLDRLRGGSEPTRRRSRPRRPRAPEPERLVERTRDAVRRPGRELDKTRDAVRKKVDDAVRKTGEAVDKAVDGLLGGGGRAPSDPSSSSSDSSSALLDFLLGP